MFVASAMLTIHQYVAINRCCALIIHVHSHKINKVQYGLSVAAGASSPVLAVVIIRLSKGRKTHNRSGMNRRAWNSALFHSHVQSARFLSLAANQRLALMAADSVAAEALVEAVVVAGEALAAAVGKA